MDDRTEQPYASYLNDAFAFLQNIVIPNLQTSIDDTRFHVLLHESPRYDISIVAIGERYQIIVNEGTIERLIDFCQAYADLENPLLQSHLEQFSELTNQKDTALGATFSAGLVFLLLHEFSHIAGGHVAFALSSQDRFQESETVQELHETRQMAELEADGMAFALLFEFRDEFVASMGIAPPSTEYQEAVFARTLLLGVVAAISLLEGMFACENELDEDYPYPAIRLLNLCSSYLRVVAPDIVKWRDDDYWVTRQDDKTIDAIGSHFKATIAPTLFILHDALLELGLNSELHATSDDPRNLQGFMSDALLLLGGSTPKHSADGKELADLSNKRPGFLVAMAPYREMDLWHAVGGI